MKKIFLSLILIAITLNSNPIDAKQLFNIEKVKVKKEPSESSGVATVLNLLLLILGIAFIAGLVYLMT